MVLPYTGRLKPLKPLEPCQWFCHTGRWRRSKTSHLLDCGPWALCAGRWRHSKTSHLLDCGRWALCETVGGVAQTVGSGLWRAKSFFSSGPKLPFKPLKPLEPCQWFCHTGRLLNSLRTWTMSARYGIPNVFLWISSLGCATQTESPESLETL